jgi:hypothetical protein
MIPEMRMPRRFFFPLCLLLLLWLRAAAQVPAVWPVAKAELIPKLRSIDAAVRERWNGAPVCVPMGNDLGLANCNRGYDLINPATQPTLFATIDSMLAAFARLGMKAVSVDVHYPILVDGFPNRDKYLAFYEHVAQRVHARGMTMVTGCQSVFTDSIFGEPQLVRDVRAHYQGLTTARFRLEKAQQVQLMIDRLAPEYMTLEMEPQTQGYNLLNLVDYSIDGTVGHIAAVLQGLRKGATKVGAGAGTWDSFDYFRQFAERTAIDYLDFHVYPPAFRFIDDMAFRIDSLAKRRNKDIVISEAWCYKATEEELRSGSGPVATSSEMFARDVFDFWIPVDTLFVKTMVDVAQFAKAKAVCFFWPSVLYGYLTWDIALHGPMTAPQRMKEGQRKGYLDMFARKSSPSGDYLRDAIARMCATTSIGDLTGAPGSISPGGAWPNPFSTSCTLPLRAARDGGTNSDTPILFQDASVIVYDVLGRAVANLSARLVPGACALRIERSDLPGAGTYLVSIRHGHEQLTARLTLLP